MRQHQLWLSSEDVLLVQLWISTDLSACAVSTVYPVCLFESHFLRVLTTSHTLQGGEVTDFSLAARLRGRRKKKLSTHPYSFLLTYRGPTGTRRMGRHQFRTFPPLLLNPLTEDLNFKGDFALNFFPNEKCDITA